MANEDRRHDYAKTPQGSNMGIAFADHKSGCYVESREERGCKSSVKKPE
jgi:hypothetical protein